MPRTAKVEKPVNINQPASDLPLPPQLKLRCQLGLRDLNSVRTFFSSSEKQLVMGSFDPNHESNSDLVPIKIDGPNL